MRKDEIVEEIERITALVDKTEDVIAKVNYKQAIQKLKEQLLASDDKQILKG